MELSHNYLLSKQCPKTFAFKRMEQLIKAMQHPQTGVPVKTQKLFLTHIPMSFTGENIIEWLINRLSIDNRDEAYHLASLLCKFGYFYHITSNGNQQVVKDNSELFRFQAPYFWISTNWNAGDTDLAIYLVKRTLRNTERHGLDEDEFKLLNDLKKKLPYQWDFIRMQADSQLKVLNNRKKQDKAIIDSQERAFWNILRNSYDSKISILDEDIKKTRCVTISKQAKLTAGIKRKLQFLRQALKNRVRAKSSQLLQSLCKYYDWFYDHDGLVGICLPSNPWITEDTSYWEINAPLVDNPTQIRMKRWSFSLKELLADPTGVKFYLKFCEGEFSGESLRFYLECQQVKKTPTNEIPFLVQKIYDEYLSSHSGTEVNITDTTRNKITKNLTNPTRDILYEAEKHIYELMKKNSYPRYIQSDKYKDAMAKAPIIEPKIKYN